MNDLSRSIVLALIVLLLSGATLIRTYNFLGTPKNGMAFDATWDLADGLRISRGIPFPAYFDTRSEPIHRWMIAASFLLFGPSLYAAQVLQVFSAVLTVALTYAAGLVLLEGRSWRRLGALIAAGAMAASVPHLFLSRIAYHAVLVAPVVALTFILLLKAARSGKTSLWYWGGFVGALNVHTYQAGIPSPGWVIGFIVHQLIFARAFWLPRRARLGGWALAGMVPPLLVWFTLIALVPNLFFRLGEAGGKQAFTVQRIISGMLEAPREYFQAGYHLPLYNTPDTPYLNPAFAALALIGVGLMLWRWRHADGALLIGGLLLFTVPGALSEAPTHPNRLTGTLPLLALLAGWGAAFLLSWLERFIQKFSLNTAKIAAAAASLLIALSFAASLRAYQGLFTNPARYDPPNYWLNIPHNYIIALTEGLELLTKVDKPTYVPLGILNNPAAAFVVQREAFPNVTTWARYGLQELPAGQYLFPVYNYYHEPTAEGDLCTALLLPTEKTIVILPCGLHDPLVKEPRSEQTQVIRSPDWGWDIARISPVARAPFTPPQLLPVDQAPELGKGLRLVGQQTTELIPGQENRILLYWQVTAPQPADVFSVAQLLDLRFIQFGSSDHPVNFYLYPSARWQPGDVIPDLHAFVTRSDLPDGIYRYAAGGYVPPSTARLPITQSPLRDLWLGGAIRLPKPQPGTVPSEAVRLDARFADGIRLAGYDLSQNGSAWTIKLYWQVNAPPKGDYILFLHAVENDKLVAQQDVLPLDGKLPTWAWTPGEVITTTHALTIPTGAKVDALFAGLYTTNTLERLSVTQDGKPSPDKRVLLWTLPK